MITHSVHSSKKRTSIILIDTFHLADPETFVPLSHMGTRWLPVATRICTLTG